MRRPLDMERRFCGNRKDNGYGWLSLADFAGNGSQAICLRFLDPKEERDRILVFDRKKGKSAQSRDLHEYQGGFLGIADVDGDRCDELLAFHNGYLRVLNRELMDVWRAQ